MMTALRCITTLSLRRLIHELWKRIGVDISTCMTPLLGTIWMPACLSECLGIILIPMAARNYALYVGMYGVHGDDV